MNTEKETKETKDIIPDKEFRDAVEHMLIRYAKVWEALAEHDRT